MKGWKSRIPTILLVVVVGALALLASTGRVRFSNARPDLARDSSTAGDQQPKGHLVGGRVVLDEEAYRAAGIREATVVTGSVASTLHVNGEVRLADGHWAGVSPRMGGLIRELHAKPSDDVSIGTSLCTVESAELGDAVAAYLSAVSEKSLAEQNLSRWRRLEQSGFESGGGTGDVGWVDLDQAMADYVSASSEFSLNEKIQERAKDLLAKGLRTQTELWSAEQDLERARIRKEASRRRLGVLGAVATNEAARSSRQMAAATAKLRAAGLLDSEIAKIRPEAERSATSSFEVRSPLAGVVLERQATLGESVDPKDVLFTVADLSIVWVHAALYERDLALVRSGMPARVHVQGIPDDFIPGKLLRIGLRVDEKTRTLDLEIEATNDPASVAAGKLLRPGMFATVDLEVSRKAEVLVVPAAAVQVMGGETVVFVRAPPPGDKGPVPGKDDDKDPEKDHGASKQGDSTRPAVFERREVVVGARDGDAIEIVKGLSAGESVCIENAFLLKGEFEKSKIVDED